MPPRFFDVLGGGTLLFHFERRDHLAEIVKLAAGRTVLGRAIAGSVQGFGEPPRPSPMWAACANLA